jgi:hypothetical protein
LEQVNALGWHVSPPQQSESVVHRWSAAAQPGPVEGDPGLLQEVTTVPFEGHVVIVAEQVQLELESVL